VSQWPSGSAPACYAITNSNSLLTWNVLCIFVESEVPCFGDDNRQTLGARQKRHREHELRRMMIALQSL